MNKSEYMVFFVDAGFGVNGEHFSDMPTALNFMQELRKIPNVTFITMASENSENVGKMGVDSVIDGKCADGGDFLGRLSRHGMLLKRGR